MGERVKAVGEVRRLPKRNSFDSATATFVVHTSVVPSPERERERDEQPKHIESVRARIERAHGVSSGVADEKGNRKLFSSCRLVVWVRLTN